MKIGDIVKIKLNGRLGMIVADYRGAYGCHAQGFDFLIRLEDLQTIKMDSYELMPYENTA